MKYLYIIRHAKSDWEDLTLPDIVRPLNERGKQSVYIIANFLKENKIIPDLILSSPATRALHTAIGVSDVLGYPNNNIFTYSEIYFKGREGMLDVISSVGNKKSNIFIFSHEPSCSELIYFLTGEAVMKFPTAAIFGIKFKMDNWSEIFNHKGEKVLFTSPKQIQPKIE
jgi:phosphohistidine phosphatase